MIVLWSIAYLVSGGFAFAGFMYLWGGHNRPAYILLAVAVAALFVAHYLRGAA